MLKHVFLFAALVTGLTEIKADCSSNYLSVYPTSDTIPKNSLFLLEGYGMSQKIVNGLNKEYPVYLESGKDKIKLLVKEILVGEFQLTQALMRPEIPLQKDVVYVLKIDNLPSYEHIEKYDYETRKYKPVTFVAADFTDTISPVFQKNPVEVSKSFIAFGCGPSRTVNFDCAALDTSGLLVRTTVKNIASGKSTTYILNTNGSKIYVGHGMCSGEFYFRGEDNFEVTFVFMDQCGNFSAPSPPIQFTEPTPADYKEED
jgi:hypothetical protein